MQTVQAKRSPSFVGPRHHRMLRLLAAARTDGLHVWTVVTHMLKQPTSHYPVVGAGRAVIYFSP
jgi:hypothetical protein